MMNTKLEGTKKSKFLEETKAVFNSDKFVENGKAIVLTSAWCGRRDGGMIFNSNDLEVAPPHTRGVMPRPKF